MHAMILAAGRGERLRPITNNLPKCLVKIGNECLLEKHFNMLIKSGVRKVVINLGWLGEKIVEFAGSGERFGLEITYSSESDQILETGGGITKALPLLGDHPFWVINGDIYTNFIVPEVTLGDGVLGHLILVPRPTYKIKGDFDLDNNKVLRNNNPSLTFSGIALYDPRAFKGMKPERFSIVPLLNKLIDHECIEGSLFEGIWEDVGTPERLTRLNSI